MIFKKNKVQEILSRGTEIIKITWIAEKIKRDGNFDAEWYLSHNQDIANIHRFSKNPALHYLMHGQYEGRRAPPGFSLSSKKIDNNHSHQSLQETAPKAKPPSKYNYSHIHCIDPVKLPEGRDLLQSEWRKIFNLKEHQTKPSPKISSINHYTVVSAVYNVEAYLDEYFISLVNQTLDFEKNIHLIMVDDGSQDRSSEIIKSWQEKFPENITYIHQENNGQADARNHGLQYVQTPWVTFVDPDDFLAPDYFAEADAFIQKNQQASMLACKLVFWLEQSQKLADTHALRNQYEKDYITNPTALQNHFQLSASSSFFLTQEIKKHRLTMEKRIRPNFEDAHFIGRYLALTTGQVAFLSKPNYIYRKRATQDSTVDTSWLKREKYSSLLEYGYLDLLEQTKSVLGYIPRFTQRTVLYDLIWHIKYLLNSPQKTSFLDESEKQSYHLLLKRIFSYIDPEIILGFNLPGIWFMHKVGILHAFKKTSSPFQIVYVEQFDFIKNQVLLHYCYGEHPLEEFRIAGRDIFPLHEKNISHQFVGENFSNERWIWLPVPELDSQLSIWLNGHESKISIKGKQYGSSVSTSEIKKIFNSKNIFPGWENGGTYLFMDRVTAADDNAEHLYRYVMEKHPHLSMRFLLQKSSPDWERLENEKFKLMEYGSNEHRNALKNNAPIISSHADQAVLDPFGDGKSSERRFIFLQHGVIKDDLSRWLNTKARIDLFLTSSPAEHESIVQNGSLYKYSNKEVIMTGLPRHDFLKSNHHDEGKKYIAIMPTWRKYLTNGDQDFMSSDYAEHWIGLLQNKNLRSMVENYGYKVIFYPHFNMKPFFEKIAIPDWIEVAQQGDYSIQKVFQESSILLTDYSSVAFEVAYLNKPIIYWQFDMESFFSAEHTYDKGYFDYQEDGLGPVCRTQEDVLTEIEMLLAGNAVVSPIYADRMRKIFAWRDGNCCSRTIEVILNLDYPAKQLDFHLMKQHAERSEAFGNYELAWLRWNQLYQMTQTYKPQNFTQEAENAIRKLEPIILATLPWLIKNQEKEQISEPSENKTTATH